MAVVVVIVAWAAGAKTSAMRQACSGRLSLRRWTKLDNDEESEQDDDSKDDSDDN